MMLERSHVNNNNLLTFLLEDNEQFQKASGKQFYPAFKQPTKLNFTVKID